MLLSIALAISRHGHQQVCILYTMCNAPSAKRDGNMAQDPFAGTELVFYRILEAFEYQAVSSCYTLKISSLFL